MSLNVSWLRAEYIAIQKEQETKLLLG